LSSATPCSRSASASSAPATSLPRRVYNHAALFDVFASVCVLPAPARSRLSAFAPRATACSPRCCRKRQRSRTPTPPPPAFCRMPPSPPARMLPRRTNQFALPRRQRRCAASSACCRRHGNRPCAPRCLLAFAVDAALSQRQRAVLMVCFASTLCAHTSRATRSVYGYYKWQPARLLPQRVSARVANRYVVAARRACQPCATTKFTPRLVQRRKPATRVCGNAL